MKQSALIVVFACLLQNEWIVATIPSEVRPDPRFLSQISSSLDCTQFSYDSDVLSSFPFITYLNPLKPTSLMTYGIMDTEKNVYKLYIVNQRFVPVTVFCLKSLQTLYVRNTSFYDGGVPPEIERLALSLKTLEIYDTTLSYLSEQIGRLSRLTTLRLSNTGLPALPNSIGDLSLLSYLYLVGNKLMSLPTTMANLQSLSSVYLDNNLGLRSVQSLNGLPRLYQLRTTNCPIERLPVDLPRLYTLSMFNNRLTDLIDIGTLGNNTSTSKSFYFNMNRIRFVPPQIRNVRNLYRLELDNNELQTLPTEIFNVTTLRYLYIRNNKFSASELKAIIAKFNMTNPLLNLSWSYVRSLAVKK